ncbi:zinc finger protein 43-like isoform X2 [Ornithodoros turicata]|uniref:zinc finger protein 43-like isoform X2 n=1 Tax=Ornithodoros turicata TaxID=34597 RepID=UPI0031390094
MDAGDGSNGSDTQRHVCGLCWTSFSSPTELQQHCLRCFSEDNSETKASEEGPPPPPEEETKDEEGNCDIENSPSPNLDAADEPDDDSASVREDSPTTSSLPDGKTLHLCKLCPKTFTNYGSYRRHLRMHSCGHRYTCDICGKQFFRRYLWIKHYEKIHNSMMQNMCQCCTCEVWLKNSDTLKEHIRTKHRCVQSPSSDISEPIKKPSDTVVLDSVSLKPISGVAKETSDDGDDYEGKHVGTPRCQWMCNICTDSFVTKAHLMKHKEDKHGRKRSWMSKSSTPDVEVKQKKVSETTKDLFQNMLSEFSLKKMLSTESPLEKPKPKKEPSCTVELPSTFSPTFAGGGLCDPTKRGVFLCEICKKTFINRSSYLRHKKMHTGVRPYICDQCCMSFFRSESLTTHKKKHAPNDPYKCFVCGHEDATAAGLSSHFISTHSKLPEEYDSNAAARSKRGRPSKYPSHTMICPTDIPKAPPMSPRNVENLDTDANSDDTVLASLNGDTGSPSAAADKYTCLVCFKFFPDEQAYYDHQCNDDYLAARHQKDSSSQVDTNDTVRLVIMATCKLCLEKFSSEEGLFRHMVTHISCWSRICGYCGQYFKENNELTEHVLSEHSSQDEPIKHCFYCRQKFDEGSALKGHVLEVHDMIFHLGSSTASVAWQSNGSKSARKNNLTKCSEERDFHTYTCRCEGCGTPFEDFKSSMLHFRDKHSTIVTLDNLTHGTCTASTINGNDCCTKCNEASVGSASPCNLCSRSYSDGPEVHAHQQERHMLVDWYCCDACDASGPQDVMEKHVLSHLSKVGSLLLPEGMYRPSFLSGTTEPFWKVQEAFVDWCKNGSSGVKSLHANGKASYTMEMRTKTRSEILIEEAKKCTIQNGHIVPAPRKDELSKDLIDLLPKNGEITMIPIKNEPICDTSFESSPFSQLRSALTRKMDVLGGDKNGNILKALLGEKREPFISTDQSDNTKGRMYGA